MGFFGYDLVRTVEPLGEPNLDPVGLPDMALMLSDVLYHLTVLLHSRARTLADAEEVLNGRRR